MTSVKMFTSIAHGISLVVPCWCFLAELWRFSWWESFSFSYNFVDFLGNGKLFFTLLAKKKRFFVIFSFFLVGYLFQVFSNVANIMLCYSLCVYSLYMCVCVCVEGEGEEVGVGEVYIHITYTHCASLYLLQSFCSFSCRYWLNTFLSL